MYIPWGKIVKKIKNKQNFIKKLLLKLKYKQNLNYIKKNYPQVVKKLKEKIEHKEKLNVAFYVYDETKWKSQSVWELMEKDELFNPYIFAAKNHAPKDNCNFQLKEELKRVYDFFKNKNMNVLYAWDFEKDDFIPFDKMPIKPDIVIYQHPWYIKRVQGPVYCSKFALTFYIPYIIPTSVSPIEYYLRFHQYVNGHFVLNDEIKKTYSKNMKNKGKNLIATGHPQLDYFYLNKNNNVKKADFVIFAPHWSIDENNNPHWSSFLWSAEFMLEYAKAHPEINWVFKPHPILKNYLKNKMTDEQIGNYWQEWAKIGLVMESGDYLDLFGQSCLMVTDCGSFLTEYLLSENPVIHLKVDNPTEFNTNTKKIVESYYGAKNKNELENLLHQLLFEKNDTMKSKRLEIINNLNFKNCYAAKNIIDCIKKILGVIV